MFRRRAGAIEVLLVHPGGPFFRNKDAGCWTIPKGEAAFGEDLLTRARIEFEEELGLKSNADCFPLGCVKQKGGKTVHAWAFEGDLPANFELRSNTFTCEWPPRSGRIAEFPEVDRASFFPLAEARERINPAQVELLDRLHNALQAELR
jgi:predicted NUDIX family NTP pyrophosphohydrolase